MQKSASLASYSAASDQKRLKIYSCFASVNTMSLPGFTSGSGRAAGRSGKEDPSRSAGGIVHISQCCCQRISFFLRDTASIVCSHGMWKINMLLARQQISFSYRKVGE